MELSCDLRNCELAVGWVGAGYYRLLRGDLEGRVLVGHRCLVMGGFGRFAITILVALGIEEFNSVDIDEVPVVLGARLLVVPRFRTLAALEKHPAPLTEKFADDLCPAAEGLYGKPFRVILQFAVLVPSIVRW